MRGCYRPLARLRDPGHPSAGVHPRARVLRPRAGVFRSRAGRDALIRDALDAPPARRTRRAAGAAAPGGAENPRGRLALQRPGADQGQRATLPEAAFAAIAAIAHSRDSGSRVTGGACFLASHVATAKQPAPIASRLIAPRATRTTSRSIRTPLTDSLSLTHMSQRHWQLDLERGGTHVRVRVTRTRTRRVGSVGVQLCSLYGKSVGSAYSKVQRALLLEAPDFMNDLA